MDRLAQSAGKDCEIHFGGMTMASGAMVSKPVDSLPLARKPELKVVRDLNDYPATARCSSCGEEMPARQRWINSAAENLAWFADQFRMHLEHEHPFWSPEL